VENRLSRGRIGKEKSFSGIVIPVGDGGRDSSMLKALAASAGEIGEGMIIGDER